MYKNMILVGDQLDQHEGGQNGELVQVYGRRRRVYVVQFYRVGRTDMYVPDLSQNWTS